MTHYREILRLHALGFSQQNIAYSCGASKKTVNKVIRLAQENNLAWPLPETQTDDVLAQMFSSPTTKFQSTKRMPSVEHIHRELMRKGVSKKLLWTEYLEECRLCNESPLMYSQFCYYIQQDEQKRRASMHIPRKPAEQVEVDWAGDPAKIIDPDTGEITKAYLFVGVMTYSQYAFVMAFVNEKQRAWIRAHVCMYKFFGGVARILVPDNCKTAVIHNRDWYTPQLNVTYHELAEHYGTAIIPARVRAPKDKPNAEGTVGNISTWITAALRDEQFFSLFELNQAIRVKLDEFNQRPFQKKEGSRYALFHDEELPLLTPLPAAPYELADWKTATVLFNYHISVDGMLYSVPYEYIGHKVDMRVTDNVIEIFYNHKRIASHRRLRGRKGQYSSVREHMPEDHQQYLEWNGDKFRSWAEQIGPATGKVIAAILSSHKIEQQSYRSCMGLLKLSEKTSAKQLEAACENALGYTATPSYRSIKTILSTKMVDGPSQPAAKPKSHGITRGAAYYGRKQP